MGYANLQNLPNKGVDLSAVTQAAQLSPLTSGARSGGTTLPPSGNPSTSLYNAGAVSQMGQNFANLGSTIGQIPIPGPNVPSSQPSGPPANAIWSDSTATGPGGVRKGDYDSRILSQDQRQWLWEQFGHKGTAPVGYGGERPPAPAPTPTPTSPVAFLPSFTPPPSPVPGATFQPRGASGATQIPSATLTGGGVSGQAFPALTQAGNALSGLGNLTSLPASVLSGIMKQLTTPGLGIFSSPTPQAQANKPLVEGYNPQADTGGARDVLKPFAEGVQRTAQDIILGGGAETIGRLPRMALEALPGIVSGASKLAKPVTGAIGGLFGLGATAPESEGAYKQSTRQFGETAPEGDFKAAQRGTTPATSKNILGNIPVSQAPQAIITALRDDKRMDDVIAGIASEEVKPVITSMIQTAARQGDMGTVHQLIGILNGVQKQLNFNNMIQQAVTAISAGFGVPNAPGVTAARLPMVQQGIGRALETPFQVPSAPGFTQQTSPAQSLSPRLPTAEVQQQKPQLTPYMGA